MFSIFQRKKSLIEGGIFDGLCDYHSHILPCVDDGVQSEQEVQTVLLLSQNEVLVSVSLKAAPVLEFVFWEK